MDQNWFYLIEQASDMSKIKLSLIIYACCLNKTIKTINKLTNEQPSSHFFLTDPLLSCDDYVSKAINASLIVFHGGSEGFIITNYGDSEIGDNLHPNGKSPAHVATVSKKEYPAYS